MASPEKLVSAQWYGPYPTSVNGVPVGIGDTAQIPKHQAIADDNWRYSAPAKGKDKE